MVKDFVNLIAGLKSELVQSLAISPSQPNDGCVEEKDLTGTMRIDIAFVVFFHKLLSQSMYQGLNGILILL